MENNQKKFAVLVHACDRYELLYKGFEFFFNKYWDFDACCNYYFATEEKVVDFKGFTNIRVGKGSWSDRFIRILRDHIKEDYVFYIQEDMWLTKPVNGKLLNEVFELSKANQWKQVKLESAEFYATSPTSHFVEGFNITLLDNKNSAFLMSHQVVLWDRQYVLSTLRENEHPWRNQRRADKRLLELNTPIYHVDAFAENGKAPVNNNPNPINRSEYFSVSFNGTLDYRIEPYIKELMEDKNEEYHAYAKKLHYQYINKLTHDGKPKPRKEDIFRKIKRWVTGK